MAYDSKKKSEDPKELHKQALEEFAMCRDADKHNREAALEDLKFWRLGEQWPEGAKSQRALEQRPCLTFNKGPTFIRQVVNEGRQNKPAIKVHPADDTADVQTADIINGLIRNIEYSSNADVAYDTGLDFGASCGIGYWRVGIEYAHDDTFDLDIEIQRIDNPLAVYRDYATTAADSSDWMRCFVIDSISKEEFEAKYKGKEPVDWDGDLYGNMPQDWCEGKNVIIAEYWCRKEVTRTICLMSNGDVMAADWLDETVQDLPIGAPDMTNEEMLALQGITRQSERETKSYEVKQHIMNGVEILETNDWAGRYIPIVPVYGEEINVEGKRYYRSMLRDARSAQENFNYWRSASTELVALAPKAPFIGPAGSFVTDADKWATANTIAHAYIEFDLVPEAGGQAPQRQQFAGVPAGVLQEALNASDDMKSVIGIYDAGLGARSNETSGIAIGARKAESDTGTFHFIDNQARAIRHTGRIIIDLIPHVYNKARVVRIMGVDKEPQNVPINQPLQPGQVPQDEDGMAQIYDLTAGKYDLTVDTGPSFQTRREEASAGMVELLRALPQAAPILAPRLAKAQDWPDAEEVAKELELLNPAAQGKSPEAQAAQQQIQQLSQGMQQAQQQIQQLDTQLKDKTIDHERDMLKLEIEAFNAETNRLKLAVDEKSRMDAQLQAQITAESAQTPDIATGGQPGAPAEPSPEQQQQQQFNQAIAEQMQQVMAAMRELNVAMKAPRKRTLVRGPDGKASHAIDEFMVPEEPQDPGQAPVQE